VGWHKIATESPCYFTFISAKGIQHNELKVKLFVLNYNTIPAAIQPAINLGRKYYTSTLFSLNLGYP
jgi:hypothetical protein